MKSTWIDLFCFVSPFILLVVLIWLAQRSSGGPEKRKAQKENMEFFVNSTRRADRFQSSQHSLEQSREFYDKEEAFRAAFYRDLDTRYPGWRDE